MSETDNKTTLGRKPLGLKRSVEAGEVKQTFSHGRTNKVVVEVKRRRVIGKPGEAPAPAPAPAAVAAPPPPPPPAPPRKPAPSSETPQERVARLQREAEEDRLRLAEEARRREEDERLQAIEDEKRRAEENRRAEGEAAEARAAEAEEAKSVPVRLCSSTVARCMPVPTPACASDTWPCFAFAIAISSPSDFAGWFGATAITNGNCAASDTMVKSFTGS